MHRVHLQFLAWNASVLSQFLITLLSQGSELYSDFGI